MALALLGIALAFELLGAGTLVHRVIGGLLPRAIAGELVRMFSSARSPRRQTIEVRSEGIVTDPDGEPGVLPWREVAAVRTRREFDRVEVLDARGVVRAGIDLHLVNVGELLELVLRTLPHRRPSGRREFRASWRAKGTTVVAGFVAVSVPMIVLAIRMDRMLSALVLAGLAVAIVANRLHHGVKAVDLEEGCVRVRRAWSDIEVREEELEAVGVDVVSHNDRKYVLLGLERRGHRVLRLDVRGVDPLEIDEAFVARWPRLGARPSSSSPGDAAA